MVTSVASLASSLKQQQVALEVGARLMKTVKDTTEDQGEALVKLLESARMTESMVNPHLGSNIDVSA